MFNHAQNYPIFLNDCTTKSNYLHICIFPSILDKSFHFCSILINKTSFYSLNDFLRFQGNYFMYLENVRTVILSYLFCELYNICSEQYSIKKEQI